jgi:hypothetical protein
VKLRESYLSRCRVKHSETICVPSSFEALRKELYCVPPLCSSSLYGLPNAHLRSPDSAGGTSKENGDKLTKVEGSPDGIQSPFPTMKHDSKN